MRQSREGRLVGVWSVSQWDRLRGPSGQAFQAGSGSWDGLEEGRGEFRSGPWEPGVSQGGTHEEEGQEVVANGPWEAGQRRHRFWRKDAKLLSPPCYLWELTPRLFQTLHTDLRPPHAPSFQRQQLILVPAMRPVMPSRQALAHAVPLCQTLPQLRRKGRHQDLL